MFKNRPITNPFKNILLIVHCRLPSFLVKTDPALCEKRRPLYDGYHKYFGDVMFMTRDNCYSQALDPHTCVAEVIKDRAAQRDGIFYLHFDALIRPPALAPTFDPSSMAFFGQEDTCKVRYRDMALMNCSWGAWGRWAQSYVDAIKLLKSRGVLAKSMADPGTVWIGMDDLFYIPRQVFAHYTDLVKSFQVRNMHHEVAGPSIRRLLSRMTSVQDKNMSCSGDCCKTLGADVALRPDFRCGHAFRLNDNSTQDAFESVLSLDRWRLLASTEGLLGNEDIMRKILDEATA